MIHRAERPWPPITFFASPTPFNNSKPSVHSHSGSQALHSPAPRLVSPFFAYFFQKKWRILFILGWAGQAGLGWIFLLIVLLFSSLLSVCSLSLSLRLLLLRSALPTPPYAPYVLRSPQRPILRSPLSPALRPPNTIK